MEFKKLINQVNNINVYYNSKSLVVNKGNILPIDQTQQEPEINYKFDKNKYYTLFMVDPDAPSAVNPINGFWIHWIIGNISSINKGNIIMPYMGPAPPKNSGPHRYIFILAEQKNYNDYSGMYLLRPKFDLAYFMKQYNLKSVAANYFISENK